MWPTVLTFLGFFALLAKKAGGLYDLNFDLGRPISPLPLCLWIQNASPKVRRRREEELHRVVISTSFHIEESRGLPFGRPIAGGISMVN